MLLFYIDNNSFSNRLEKANIKPVYKEDDPFDKANLEPLVFYLIYLFDEIYYVVSILDWNYIIKSSMWL